MNDDLTQFAKQYKGSYLEKYIEEIKAKVCDVRTNLPVGVDSELEVRKAVVALLDSFFTRRFSTLTQKDEKGTDEYR